jgi:O-antigen/teichoic acid export membrane protein
VLKKNKEEKSNSIVLLGKSTIITLFGAVIGKGSEYLTKVVIGRYLGPELFGIFNLGLGILFFLSTICIMELTSAVIRFSAIYNSEKKLQSIREVVIVTLGISLGLGLILCITMLIFRQDIAVNIFKEKQIGSVIMIMSFALPFIVINQYFYNFLISIKRFTTMIFCREILSKTGRLAIVGFALYLGCNVIGITVVYLVIFSVMGMYGTVYLIKYFRPSTKRIVTKTQSTYDRTSKEIFLYSWPLSMSAIIVALISKIDIFAVGYFLNMEDLGIYSAAYTLAFIVHFPVYNFNEVFIPIASELYHQGRLSRIDELYKANVIWLFYLMFPLLVVMFLEAHNFILFTFGEEYVRGVYGVRILLVSIFIRFLEGPWSAIIQATGRTKIVLPLRIIHLLLLAFLNIYLIPRYGVLGAVFATAFSMISLSCLRLIYLWKDFLISPFTRRLIIYIVFVCIVCWCIKISKLTHCENLYMSIIVSAFEVIIILLLTPVVLGVSSDDLSSIKRLEARFNITLPRIFKRAVNI